MNNLFIQCHRDNITLKSMVRQADSWGRNCSIVKHVAFFQDEVRLTAPCATPKPIDLEEYILCQKKKRSEYLSSGEIGRGCIVSLAKQTESNDTRAARILQLTAQEQGIMKYHTSTCYRSFQRDMAKPESIPQPFQEPPQHGPIDDTPERRSKRFKPSETKIVCIFCGADRKTVNWKKMHKMYRICEKPMAQKLLNATMLFKDHVYTETAAMCDVEDFFLQQISDIMTIVVKVISINIKPRLMKY